MSSSSTSTNNFLEGKLVVKQVLGINPNVKHCLTFLSDHNFAYIAGHQVVVYNFKEKDNMKDNVQSFIPGTNTYQYQSLGFTAIAVCHTKKLLAIAEKIEPTGILTFYDSITLRRKKVLIYPELGSNEIKSLAFSDDGKFMAIQGNAPDFNLSLWNIEKNTKLLTSIKIAPPLISASAATTNNNNNDEIIINNVSFCPWDTSIILVIGKNILRFYRYAEGQLRPLALTLRKENCNFISYAWLQNEQLIVGTDIGEIILLESLEIRGFLNTNRENEEVTPVLCLQSTSRGFIMGSVNSEIKVYERAYDDSKEKFKLEDRFIVPGNYGKVLDFTMNSEEFLIIGFEKNQLLSCSVSSMSNLKENYTIFEPVISYFPSRNSKNQSDITGIDVALWKNVIVTCSKDHTVRVWNPNESSKRLELVKEFDEEPINCSFHPSGLYIAVSFPDKVRILSVLLDDLKVSREISLRQINFVKFSNGGQYFAVSCSTNLQIYQTYTGNCIATLRGHNNRIRSIVWQNCDAKIITIGVDGIVYTWDLFPLMKGNYHYNGNLPIYCGDGTLDGSQVFISCHDKQIKELCFNKNIPVISTENPDENDQNNSTAVTSSANPTNNASILSSLIEGSVKVTTFLDFDTAINHMVYDQKKRLLLLGTSNTSGGPSSLIITPTYPVLGGVNSTYYENIIHSAPITALCLSYDGETIYSGDANGCLCISTFENSLSKLNTSQNLAINQGNQANNNASQREVFDFEFNEEVMINKKDLEIKKNLLNELNHNVLELKKNNYHQLQMKEIEHNDKLSEIIKLYEVKLNNEKIKYNELENEKKSIETKFSTNFNSIIQRHNDEINELENKYATKCQNEQLRHQLLVEENLKANAKFSEENNLLIVSQQNYVQELTKNYEIKINNEQKLIKEIEAEKIIIQNKYEQLKDSTEVIHENEVNSMDVKYKNKLKIEEDLSSNLKSEHAVFQKHYDNLFKDSGQHKIEIKRLKDKEARLQETLLTLEKDIASHNKESNERDETINDKEKRIFDLKKKNQELEKFRFVLDYKIKELKLQIAPRENEINIMRKQIEEMKIELEQYNKSNSSLNLMINELKIKLNGIKNEILKQNSRYNLNLKFFNKFKKDLSDLWLLNKDPHAFKNYIIKMYRLYVQDDGFSSKFYKTNDNENAEGNANMDDPQVSYNRDREQMERSLDSLRRAIKTEGHAHKRDVNKMMRESVLLTKELNSLRKISRSLLLQKKAIDNTTDYSNEEKLSELMQLLGLDVKKLDDKAVTNKPETAILSKKRNPLNQSNRTVALRTTSADGITTRTKGDDSDMKENNLSSTNATKYKDQWEAWRQIQLQYEEMNSLEDSITKVCEILKIDPIPVIVGVDSSLIDL